MILIASWNKYNKYACIYKYNYKTDKALRHFFCLTKDRCFDYYYYNRSDPIMPSPVHSSTGNLNISKFLEFYKK